MVKTVIVLGDHVQGLGVIQIAGRLGLNTALFNGSKLCVAAFSKYCNRFVLYKDTGELLKKILNFYGGEKEAIIIPTNDYLIDFLSLNRDELNKYYYLAIPPRETTDVCLNKILTYQKALDCDTPVLKFSAPQTLQEALTSASEIKYPVVLRPAFMHKFFAKTGQKIILCHSEEDLIRNYNLMASQISKNEIMVQEYVPEVNKKLFSFCSFFAEGQVYGGFTLYRSRQRPKEFGISTFAETVVIKEIEELAVNFLKKINYFGISEIEFIYDEKTKTYNLIEINPRTWKQHAIAEKLNINLIKMVVDYFNGSKLRPVMNDRTGVGWVEPLTDFAAGISSIFRGKLNMSQYFNSLKIEKKVAVFSKDDIMPGVMYILLLPYLFRERR